MDHQPNCRCPHPHLVNNNNIQHNRNGLLRQISSSDQDGSAEYEQYANGNRNHRVEQESSHSYGGDSLDSDDSLTEFSHASSMLTSHDRPCYVTIRACTCGALAYVFCLKDSMGCLSRSMVAFLWLVVISLMCNMVTRYVAFTDTSRVMTSADMRLMDQSVSTIFCTSNVVIGEPTGYSSEYISYLLPWKPPVIPNKYYNQTINYHSVVLAPDTYKYYQFYFLKGSLVSLSFKVLSRRVTFMALKGENSFKQFQKSPNCGYECTFYITARTSTDDQVRFSFSAYENNEFYFVFVDGYENWRSGSEFSVDFQFQRTRYDLTYIKSSCAAGYGSCRYSLEFGSSEVVAVVIPESADSSIKITSSCKPRSLIYVIFFVLTPFSVVMLVTVIIYTTSKVCRCASRRPVVLTDYDQDDSSPEYDIMPTFDNLTVTENTPLLNPTLPSYDQAVSERLAEDMLRADPPPSYHAAIQRDF